MTKRYEEKLEKQNEQLREEKAELEKLLDISESKNAIMNRTIVENKKETG